jgi:hypothetical protein
MLLSGDASWTEGVQHISRLQQLQHLQLHSDAAYLAANASPSMQDVNLPALFRCGAPAGQLLKLAMQTLFCCNGCILMPAGNHYVMRTYYPCDLTVHTHLSASLADRRCTALWSLAELDITLADQPAALDSAVLPHLTYLRCYQSSRGGWWPAVASPNLQSLYLISPAREFPSRPQHIPGCSSITQLTLCVCPEAFNEQDTKPNAANLRAMAAALPQLRALQLIIPAEIRHLAAVNQRRCLCAWLGALSGFTQIQQLTLTVPNYHMDADDLQPVLPQEVVLRALCKLQQLQQLTLHGWVWGVSPLFVVGLEVGLQQLTSIRLEGCGGGGQAAAGSKAEMRESVHGLAADMRPGLQLVYIE